MYKTRAKASLAEELILFAMNFLVRTKAQDAAEAPLWTLVNMEINVPVVGGAKRNRRPAQFTKSRLHHTCKSTAQYMGWSPSIKAGGQVAQMPIPQGCPRAA